jgi:hypothetical protein
MDLGHSEVTGFFEEETLHATCSWRDTTSYRSGAQKSGAGSRRLFPDSRVPPTTLACFKPRLVLTRAFPGVVCVAFILAAKYF